MHYMTVEGVINMYSDNMLDTPDMENKFNIKQSKS